MGDEVKKTGQVPVNSAKTGGSAGTIKKQMRR